MLRQWQAAVAARLLDRLDVDAAAVETLLAIGDRKLEQLQHVTPTIDIDSNS